LYKCKGIRENAEIIEELLYFEFWGMLAFTMLHIKSDFLEPEYSVPNRNWSQM